MLLIAVIEAKLQQCSKKIEYLAEAYKVGERFAQLVILPYPEIELEEAEELSATERGTGGYGSTGK